MKLLIGKILYGYKLVFQSRLTRQKVYYHHFFLHKVVVHHIHILLYYEGEEGVVEKSPMMLAFVAVLEIGETFFEYEKNDV